MTIDISGNLWIALYDGGAVSIVVKVLYIINNMFMK